MDCDKKFDQKQFSEDYNIDYYNPCFELCNMKLQGKFSQQLSGQFLCLQYIITGIIDKSRLISLGHADSMQSKEKDIICLDNRIQKVLDSHLSEIEAALSHTERSEVWDKHNQFLMHWLGMLELLGVPLSIVNNQMHPGITSLQELCFSKSESPLIAQPICIDKWSEEDSSRVRSILQDQFKIFKQEMSSISQDAYKTSEYFETLK